MNALPSISSQIDEDKIFKIINKNFSKIAPFYYHLITSWLIRSYNVFQDIDKFVILIYFINKDLISVFSKNNIKPIESLNKKLDPNFHQAMMEIEDDKNEPGTIVQEIQKGFTIKDRLLRPSLVGVAKKTQEKTAKKEETRENSEIK